MSMFMKTTETKKVDMRNMNMTAYFEGPTLKRLVEKFPSAPITYMDTTQSIRA